MQALAASPVERLLQRLRPHESRRLSRRELRMEAVSGALLAAVVASMALTLPAAHHPPLIDVAALIALHAVCCRVRLYLGAGYGMPTQLVLVPMLFVLPPAAVPAAVAAGLCLAALPAVLRGAEHPGRVLSAASDAWHAVGPALVFAALGSPEPDAANWLVLVPAVAAQAVADSAGAIAREWIGRGISPGLQLRVMGWVYGVDVMLTPLAFLAVIAPVAGERGWLLLAPLVALLAALLADRNGRIAEASDRVDELRRERVRLQAVLRRAGGALAANLDRDAMLAAILGTAREALDAGAGWAGSGAVPGHGGGARPALAAAVAVAGEQNGPARATQGEWHALACRLGRRAEDEVLAVARTDEPFSDDEAELLDHLAMHAAISLENARLHARVRRQATLDDLTGLENHRSLHMALEEHLREEGAAARGLSLVMLDIDDFKRVNDTWGHVQGDQVLREVAGAIRSRCRQMDRAARYGGEELAVALPGTSAAEALRIAEDLRRAVEAVEVPTAAGLPIRVTVSAGVATASSGAATPSELVDAADRALYAAKRAGKNRTVLAQALVAA